MKIDEIIMTPDRDHSLEKYTGYFADTARQSAFSVLTFSESKFSDQHHLGLFHDKNLISYLQLEIRTNDLWQIVYSQTDLQFRGQGCFRYLLEKSVLDHGAVLSDSHQTGLASAAWKSLIQYPGGLMLIFVYNTVTKHAQSAHDVDPGDIWNQRENPVLLAKKISYTVKEQANMQHRDQRHIQKQTGRDHVSIWFGPGTSNHNYYNP
jgi:hypothetical protein